MPKAHATLSASGAHRWIACPPSALFEQMFPAETSEYAEEGTAAHRLCEIMASTDLPENRKRLKANFMRTKAGAKYYNEEMQEAADAYVEAIQYIREDMKDEPTVLLEQKVDFSNWVPDGFGTADCIMITEGRIDIIDFKYGKGVAVSAEGNPQMRLYALGALQTFAPLLEDVEEVQTHIVQPRISKAIQTEKTSKTALLEWGETVVKPAAALAVKGAGEYGPGEEACRFCRGRAACKARARTFTEAFEEHEDVNLLSLEEAAEILVKTKTLETWLGDLKNRVTFELLSGTPVPGWKLVEGRSNRKLKDEKEALDRMLAEGIEEPLLFERNMLSLAKMEKAFGKKLVEEVLGDLIEKPQGAPSLAPASDKRPEYVPADAIIKAFDEEDPDA